MTEGSARARNVRRPFISLAEARPDLAAQWDYERNGDLTPEQVHVGTNKRAHWVCNNGPDHKWDMPVDKRTGRGDGCPFCSNKRVSVTNSLATLYPEIAAEWHPTANGGLTPSDVVPGSNKTVTWRCSKDQSHVWPTRVVARTRGYGCPYCARVRCSPATSLASVSPDIAAQWHPTRNPGLTPEDVAARSMRRVWWKCPNGPDHEWSTPVDARGGQGQGCPFCLGRRLSVTNSLATLYPELAAQWHPTKNGDLSPSDVVSGSNRRVWWKCTQGPDHEWEASVIHRKHAPECPFCGGFRASVTNSVASLLPEVAAQWHPVMNGDLTPDEVVAGSNKRYWWKCPNGPDHEWQEQPNIRKTSGCPFCSGRRPSVTNSLETLFPDVAKQWDHETNAPLTPATVTAYSSRRVHWTCDYGHHFVTAVSNRTAGSSGCPECQLRPESRQEIALRFELAHVFGLDPHHGKVRCGNRVYSCDIVSRDDFLVIEFDGSFWHKDRIEDDRLKSRVLQQHGWRVVRVREEPLLALESTDLVVPQRLSQEELANLVVVHLARLLGRGDVDAYISSPDLANRHRADEYIEERLRRQSARREQADL